MSEITDLIKVEIEKVCLGPCDERCCKKGYMLVEPRVARGLTEADPG